MNAKLKAINSLKRVDWSCNGGECEYVLVENSLENCLKLHEVGFTDDDLIRVYDEASETLDVATLAFENGAKWFNSHYGFTEIEVSE